MVLADMNDSLTPEECYDAVVHRSAAHDGRFIYAVATTGVYCHPSCAARTPRRENVEFFASATEAQRAGYRPCKRCRPDGPSRREREAAMVTELCRLIETSEEEPTLEVLARAAGASPHHVHRVFKAHTGITPKAYARTHRADRARQRMDDAPSVTRAIFDAGYSSSSRFYESGRLGMTPTRFRTGGAGETIRFAVGECSLGSFLVAATDRGVCSIVLGDDPERLVEELQERFHRAELVGADADFEKLVAQVVAAIDDPARGLELPLDVRGTAFQERVWRELQKIPVGERRSYSEIAAALGSPKSVRAVARACGSNPVAIAIPCHRVVRRDGGLAGYRWGVERKRALLQQEASL